MAYRNGKMQPNRISGTHSAGPNGSFPIGDATHDREAISGATRSEHAGHISASTAAGIKAKARADLGDKPDHKAEHNDSGMIRAMHDHADKIHPR